MNKPTVTPVGPLARTKLTERFAELQGTREELLASRGTRAEKDAARDLLTREIAEIDKRLGALQRKLADQTQEVGQLLHSDLAGILPGGLKVVIEQENKALIES